MSRPGRHVAILAALATLAACGEGVPAIDTGPAETALADVVRRTGFPTAGTFLVVDECPIADGQLLLERALDDVDGPVLGLALDADELAFVSAPNEDPTGDPYVACGRITPDGVGVALAISDAPGSGIVEPEEETLSIGEIDALRDSVANRYAARFGDPPEHLTVDQRRDTRGGTMYHVCISEPDQPERDSCEVAWFGGDLVVSTLVTGEAARTTDLGEIDEQFRRLLQLIVDGLADER